MITLEDLSEPAPDPGPADWNEDGVLHLPGLLDPNMVAAYFDAWAASNGPVKLNPAHNIEADGGHWDATAGAADPSSLWVLDAREPGGWQDACPYMRHPALRHQAQGVFVAQPVQLPARMQPGQQIKDLLIQERITGLHRGVHRHPVTLGVE